jgi:carbamoyltransferase
MSKIFGFYAGSHSASSSLVVDGEILMCLEEERMTRIKAGDAHESFPNLSYLKIVEDTNHSIENSDYRIFVEPLTESYCRYLSNGSYEKLSHHVAHNYGAYFTSGMEGKVLSISYDGGGESSVMRIFLCEDGKMNQIRKMDFSTTGSLSHLWGFTTSSILGYDENMEGIWKMCKDEGKLMGMAPEGEYNERLYKIFKSIIKYDNYNFYPPRTDQKTKFAMDSLFLKGHFATQKQREDVSYNLQLVTEELMLQFFSDLHRDFPEYTKICLSGGLFANVKLNQKINDIPWVQELYVYPPMGDEGLSLGACIWKSVQLGEITKPLKLSNVSFGPKYDEQKVFGILEEYDFIKSDFDPKKIAEDINEGKIIGWFQGGMEYGPRALGNRSILVRPTEYSTHTKLNERLGRYDTMPFAPMVLSDYFDDLFTNPKSKYSTQFMTICYTTKDEWIEKIPAVIQKSDKTARPQIIDEDNNPMLFELMNEYLKVSDIPVLLNTSFNIHGEPIIENPHHAFNHLKNNVVDKLVLGKYVYENK